MNLSRTAIGSWKKTNGIGLFCEIPDISLEKKKLNDNKKKKERDNESNEIENMPITETVSQSVFVSHPNAI